MLTKINFSAKFPKAISSRIFRYVTRIIKMYEYWFSTEPERPMIKYVKNNLNNKKLIGAEIGTYKGSNAYNMLKNVPNIKMLYLVDPYKAYVGYDDPNDEIVSTSVDLNEAYRFAAEKLRKYQKRIKFIKKFSENALQDIPNNLDFVYIDGNHLYEFVKRDIELYYNKVKRGGIIGGHDFDSNFPGVKKAVIEFKDKYNLQLLASRNDWWFIKR